MAGGADVAPLALAVGAAGFADVVVAVQTRALGVEQEGEGRAAADAAMLVELVLLGQKQTTTALLLQLLLHFTTESDRGDWKGGVGGKRMREGVGGDKERGGGCERGDGERKREKKKGDQVHLKERLKAHSHAE